MRSQFYKVVLLVAAIFATIFWVIPTAASLLIQYNWWKEIGQVDTWLGMLWYSVAPVGVAALLAAAALWIAHARGLHFAGVRSRDYPLYRWGAPILLALAAIPALLDHHRLLDGDALCRFARHRAFGSGMARSCVWPAAYVLFIQLAVLLANAQLRLRAGDFVRAGLPGPQRAAGNCSKRSICSGGSRFASTLPATINIEPRHLPARRRGPDELSCASSA